MVRPNEINKPKDVNRNGNVKKDFRSHLSTEDQNTLFLKRIGYSQTQDGTQKRQHLGQQNESVEGHMDEVHEAPKSESIGNYLDTIKSLSVQDFQRLTETAVDWVRQKGVKSFTGKDLTQIAKETMDWAWRNGTKSLSGHNFMKIMTLGLAMSAAFAPEGVQGVKVYGKDGCSIDTELIIDKHPAAYDKAASIAKARFERQVAKMLELYVENPCDPKYEKIRLTFDKDLRLGELGVTRVSLKHISLQPNEQIHKDYNRTLGGSFIHELSHTMQEFKEPPGTNQQDNAHQEWRLTAELRAEYSIPVFGSDQDTKRWPMPPNLESKAHYSDRWGNKYGGYYWVWLENKFPGFVKGVNDLARKKPIQLKDCEQFTNGQSLESLWVEYKQSNVEKEMKQYIKKQREKYAGSGKKASTRDEL